MADTAKSDLKVFLVKVGAVTLAALVVLYAARTWLRPPTQHADPDEQQPT